MTEGASKDQQFEQVLSRLDALIKRGHYGAASLPSVADPVEHTTGPQAATTSAPDVREQGPAESEIPASAPQPAVSSTQETSIPVLTRIYHGEIPVAQAPPGAETNAEIESLIPIMLDKMEQAMREEFASMQRTFAARLRSEIAAALQPPSSDKAHDIHGD